MDTGTRLRSAREALGLSLASLAQKTRVQPRIIAAIEHNDLQGIPPKPFGRGFIRAYAREVGLDPEQTVQEYFAQFPPAPPETAHPTPTAEPWPARTSWLGAAGLIAIMLVALAVVRGGGESAENSPPAPVGTAGGSTAPAVEIPKANGMIGRSGDVPVRPEGLSVVLTAHRECWVTATADGERTIYQLLQPGTRHSLRADREIAIRVGNAGALRLAVNGRDTGPLGTDGQVRTVRITPETAASFGASRASQ